MITPAGSNHYVELLQTRNTGAAWVVRVFKKVLFFRKVVSSDWFLDQQQAKEFAESLAHELHTNNSTDHIISRAPGWTLHHSLR